MFDLVLGHVAPNSECEYDIIKIILINNLSLTLDKDILDILNNKNIKLYKDFVKKIEEKNNTDLIIKINNILQKNKIFDFDNNVNEFNNKIVEPKLSEDFPDTIKILYDSEIIENSATDLIIEKFWKPFILKYLNKYEFNDIRIDCARKIPQNVRKKLYEYAKSLKANCKIFEENLFPKGSLEENMLKVGNVGAEFMTGDLYYQPYNPLTGFLKYVNDSSIKRSTILKEGCINFTRNHDEVPLALYIIRNMAVKLAKEKSLEFKKEVNQEEVFAEQDSNYLKALKPYIEEVVKNININTDNYKGIFLGEIIKRISTIILGSNGGYYLLDGDEELNLIPCSVFESKKDKSSDLKIDFNIIEKIKELNHIFDNINQEPSKNHKNMWLERFELNQDVSVIVRKEDLGFDCDTNIIFINHNLEKEVEINKDDLEKITCWFQKRTIPVELQYTGNNDFDQAYWTIAGGKNECELKRKIFTFGKIKTNLKT